MIRVLAIGAHPDDIEFGCGGALLRHVARGDAVTMVVMSNGARGGDPLERVKEQRRAAELLGAELVMFAYPDGALGPVMQLVERLEPVIAEVVPDVVYTHLADEMHQDHVRTHQAAKIATRDVPSFLSFESPRSPASATGVFVDITSVIDEKVALVMTHSSQTSRHRNIAEEAIRARASLHGVRFGVQQAEIFTPLRFEWRFPDCP